MKSTFRRVALILFIASTLLTACLSGSGGGAVQKGDDWDTMIWDQGKWS